jgi:hypothetical protein
LRIMLGGLFLLLLMRMDAPAVERNPQEPADWDRQLEMLRSLPYLDFSPEIVDQMETGVLYYDPERAYPGYNFYCSRSSGEAFLLDMEGRVVHRWTYPQKTGPGSDHAVLLENGDLMVIQKHQSLMRLDWDSQLIWKKKMGAHHDLVPAPDGTFYVIHRKYEIYRRMRVWFDAIIHLTADGEEIDRWYTFDHLADLKAALDTRSFLDTVLDNALGGGSLQGREAKLAKRAVAGDDYNFDYFHLNTINMLPNNILEERDARFRRGNFLVCFRNVNQIAVLEKDTYRLMWSWGEGELEWPHHPTMLENGHILIFDNGVQREYSRVLELDPLTETIIWTYPAEFPVDFYSEARGSAQRLANGNTLICESDKGRVFEVTEEGEIVWVWLNPTVWRKARETVYRMVRLPTTQVKRFLEEWWWWE